MSTQRHDQMQQEKKAIPLYAKFFLHEYGFCKAMRRSLRIT